MHRYIIFLVVVVCLGCNSTNNDSQKAIDNLQTATLQKDSLIILLQANHINDSLAFKSYRKKTVATRVQCQQYAKAVKNNPTNSVFIVNWTDRAFRWTYSYK
jgi:hypothetical protein